MANDYLVVYASIYIFHYKSTLSSAYSRPVGECTVFGTLVALTHPSGNLFQSFTTR